ncbi:MAG: U32 family peptidase [Raoultibacter sp.]
MNQEKPELLAPAGNMTCLHAAVRSGADAVYLGAERFNARRGADNFTLANLAEACDFAHLRGVRVYLTVNTAVLPDETTPVMELVRQGYRAGIDAFIVQDIGIVAEIARTLPAARVHISTQMNIHNAAGLAAVAALGAKRVTLARELSLGEIARLAAEAAALDMEVEVFAHGALCVCYSGQCFMSSLIGGRSANRGVCAQACRLPYTLHNRAINKNLESPGEHLLSPKDLCTIEALDKLVEAGVASFKIEGRMKSPEYVSTVTSVYRSVLDRVIAADGAGTTTVTEKEKHALEGVFSRGFTTAYLEGKRGNDIMSYGRPNNRGVFIGRVAGVKDGLVSIAAEEELHAGDVIEFWTNNGHFAQTLGAHDCDKDGNARVSVAKYVGKGDRVFRVRNAVSAFVEDVLQPKVPVSGTAVLRIGAPLTLKFTTAEGIWVCIEGDPVEAARTKAVSVEEVREHIDRLGNTPFVLKDLDITLDEGVGIGFSQLHKLRTRVLEELEQEMLAPYKQRQLPRVAERENRGPHPQRGCVVAAWASNPACARAAKRAGAELIYVPALNYKRGEAVVAGQVSGTVEQAGYPKQAICALPVIDHDPVGKSREEVVGFDAWSQVKADKPVFVESYGQLQRAREAGAVPEVGSHLSVTNRLALQTLSEAGAQRVWLSPELSLTQIEELGQNTPVALGLTLIGAAEMMVCEHCLLMSQGPCDQQCAVCARRKSPHYYKDRKGYEMPIITDCCGRSHLYNAVSLDLAHMAPELIRAGVSAFMVDTTLLNVAETTAAVARAVRARDLALKTGDTVAKVEGDTTGHIFRGVQ